eukprot:PhF_6_TR3399/c0_g1_i2/m.4881/K15450/TYW3; tRNA wybutosine-synthesizing protein 3
MIMSLLRHAVEEFRFFHKIDKSTMLSADGEGTTSAVAKKKRGNGLGITYCSHDKVNADLSTVDLGYPNLDALGTHGFLELKMEPVILHVLCRSHIAAQRIIVAGIAAGLKRSGAILSSKGHINVTLNGGYGFSSPLWVNGEVVVPRENVVPLLRYANGLMDVNAERRQRLLKAVESI